MNKNAAIIEGDTTKKFNPVSKVKVSNSGTGESTWIPEDSKETHSLSVTKNGIYYAASEGYTAYDTVTVNVSSETEVNYEGILMDMPDLADLGLYDLDDLEGLDGLDLDLDELQDLENLILDGDLEEGEIPTSSTKIKGIDPDSGELHEVGLDQDGNLMEQALPDHIHIVVYPRKRHYLEGEIIDFSGIHVYLMKKGTERFTCEQYPTGEIPFGELMFPVTIADGSGQSEQQASSDLFPDGVAFGSTGTLTYRSTYGSTSGQTFTETLSIDGAVTLFMFKGYSWGYLFASKSNTAIGTITDSMSGGSFTTPMCDSITHNGKTAYLTAGTVGWGYAGRDVESVSPSADPTTWSSTSAIAWTMLYGNITGGGQEIPVQWMRSDGEILEDTFPIEIVTEEVPEPEPEPDPYADAYDFIWEGKKYCFNKSLARSEVMYSNGTVWQTWLGGQSPPYTVDQALKLKLIVQVGWSGGGSTSGGF